VSDRPTFIFITCQAGAEQAVKAELDRAGAAVRLAFSRPGFLTLKLPDEHGLMTDFDPGVVFARSWGFSLGKVSGDDIARLAQEAWALNAGRPVRRVHAWPRDARPPGDRDFEPGLTDAAIAAHAALVKHCPADIELAERSRDPRAAARRGEFVLDCVLVEPDEWWIGYHRAHRGPTTWPGGIPPLKPPPDMISRAWLKTEEAIWWSRFPIGKRSPRAAELGSAPGGSTQALLARGCEVIGVDPAEMDPRVADHPRFRHIRQRASDVRRREFRKTRWLLADMNVAPQYTLDSVESIVTHTQVSIRGMLLTLKLPEWHLAAELHEHAARVESWGFNQIALRQLAFNHQEVCLAALKRPFRRNRPG